ncbi:Ferric nitrobindin-like protein OS=Streptomyces alboniger OX=132473 GN=CP975_16365 PE=3 SV=1 [Streptomyces alboniger]
MIEIPSDLHKELVPLAFLLGNWAGAGVRDFPGSEKCNFGQEVTFTHDGRDFLEYRSHTWVLDNDGNKVRPLETESGFWRIDADRKVEVTMTRDDGVVEIWYGELAHQKPQIDLVTDAVARTAASGPYTGGKRLYGYVKSDPCGWVRSRPPRSSAPLHVAHRRSSPRLDVGHYRRSTPLPILPAPSTCC